MRYLMGGVFAVLSVLLWWYVCNAVRRGIVVKPRGKAWWREYRYYQREIEPVRFWFSVTVHGLMAALATAAMLTVLFKGIES